jgi:eukaryotic-like serine/threonine-protein kinase
LLPEKATIGGTAIPVALSPDGQRMAFILNHEGTYAVWVRSLDSLDAQPLAGTEGASAFLFWSPDSRFIGFFTTGGKLKKINASGGPAQTLCDAAEPRGGAWNRDDIIIFATNSGPLWRVPASGGEPVAATRLDQARSEENHRWPCFLPDGHHFIYFTRGDQPERTGIYVGSLDQMEPRQLIETPTSAVYASPGYLLFLRPEAKMEVNTATLLAQRFDADKLELRGEPISLAEQVGYNLGLARAGVSASDNGMLAFSSQGYGTNLPIWFDRSGKEIGRLDGLGTAGTYFTLALSPDGKRAALDRIDPQSGTSDIWLVDLASRIPSRFTIHPAYDRFPIWSPDSSNIVFTSSREGSQSFYIKKTNGVGGEELLLKLDKLSIPDDWSADGRFIVYGSTGEKTKRDIWLLPMTGDRQPTPLLQTEFNETHARFSPDGKWIAYTSDESGTDEVYVQSFPVPTSRVRISTGGGGQPRWRHDGKELYYVSGKKIMAVAVDSGAEFVAGAPTELFEQETARLTSFRNSYAVSADGQRFLINAVVDATGSAPISVVVNWAAELRR